MTELRPWESLALQQAESAKYVPAQHVVVSTCDGLAIYRCRGAERHFVAIFDQPDDLAGYFIGHFSEMQLASRREYERRAALARDPLAGLELDL
jgi:hypothetical protein